MPAKESYQPLRSARSWPSAPGGSHAAILDMPVAAQIALAIPAGVVLVTLLWLVGTRLQPPAGALIVPFVAATAARLLAFMPIPLPTAAMMLGGSAYWPARPSHHQARRTMLRWRA